MKQRIFAVLLALSLSAALALPAMAAPASVPQEEAAQALSALGILSGDEQGSLNLTSQVTRAEFVTMLVRAAPGGSQIGQAAT